MRLFRTPVTALRPARVCLCVLLASALAVGAPMKAESQKDLTETISIPGPMRSFLRMAGLSQQAPAADILPLLAHQVVLDGFLGKVPTEYLLLVQRYLVQAKQLQTLAGPGHTIRVARCEDAASLFLIIGYQLRHGCTQDIVLEAVNTDRAFLTINSGFPLPELEEALQKGVPFVYDYTSFKVPLMFRESDWIRLSAGQRLPLSNCLDILLHDPAVARLYAALSKSDLETRSYLQQSLGLPALLRVAPVLDFYASRFSVRSGHVQVPGGVAAEPAWKALVGAGAATPASFANHLFTKDGGWLAAYFDALARIDEGQQQRLTSVSRLETNYEAFRSAEVGRGAAAGVFPQGSSLLVLFTRVQWEANGDPHIPGGLEVWKQLLSQNSHDQLVRQWSSRSRAFDRPDQLLQVMSALSRSDDDTSLFKLYLSLCELDRRRPSQHLLAPATVNVLATKFVDFSEWYPVFSEFPALGDEAILRFLTVAHAVERTRGAALRANVLGAFQANVGLWQILARQHQIPQPALTDSWLAMLQPFEKVTTSTQLFDAARVSFDIVVRAASPAAAAPSSDVVDLLTGPLQQSADGQRMHSEVAARMHAVLEDQRLVSLATLFALSDGLQQMEKTGEKGSDDLISLAGELRDFELPRPIFTRGEKIAYSPGVYVSRHAELQIQTDLAKLIRVPLSRAQLETARGQLAPFLRDTLVGLNYAFYEPPGAQILHINPLFVRAHDFLNVSVIGASGLWERPRLVGAGVAAGGGAFLMGSLASLPYSLAMAEENFLVPRHVQALIWVELVPNLVQEATVPRWWSLSAQELHAVGLYQRSGEEILRASAEDAATRDRVMRILAGRLSPKRLEEMQKALLTPANVTDHLQYIMPAETLYLAQEYRRLFADDAKAAGPASRELADLAARSPAEVDPERISIDFGVSHPTLAGTNARELLNLQPFPLSGGTTSRLFGESLESTNLYWARIADELGYSPVMLNRLVPELTRHMVGEIFATNIEDWPAIQRAMRATGEEFRANRIEGLRRPASAADVAKSSQREPEGNQ